ncbi:exodeoxyribonuclease III [Planktothricoides sp. SR001]|uniref:exodeoxyribonuclease III n=1 Tax=Planktothricoides sp. SR001 TaxID=1705388 RepID=UPI0006BF7953|nr:exodeoxyribonuclease III [Planktothricoides sp. SR001]KOR34479.1 exodeoxyribonuclease III [Planktothricoides sp. SR001]
MKIATWNVNSIRSRQEHLTNWLQKNPVDVICLQETKVIDSDFPRSPFEELAYHLYISGQKSYNGVAIFSKIPLQNVSVGFAHRNPVSSSNRVSQVSEVSSTNPVSEFDEQKRAIAGIFEDILILNLYVPNGSEVGSEKYEYKLQWLKVLREYLEVALKTTPNICICGDFNIALESRDIYRQTKDTEIMASPQERQSLQAILDLGFTDAFRKFNPDAGHYTWWDYRRGGFPQNRGWRIDHFYLTENLSDRAQSCIIDKEPRTWEKPSDHTPVILEL